MALFVLGFGDPLGTLIDVSRDDTGLLLDEERLPKRVRMKKATGCRNHETKISTLMLGDGVEVGTLRYDLQGRRESAAFEYGAGWLAPPRVFALGPTLPLQAGPQFHRKSKDGSLFHAAIADTETRGWARRVIMRATSSADKNCAVKDKKKRSRLNALNYLLAVDDFSVSAALRFRDDERRVQRAREEGRGSRRHSSSLDICSARHVLSRRIKRRRRIWAYFAAEARRLAACARNATVT